jgi:uracil-DNA glycosylase family 4
MIIGQGPGRAELNGARAFAGQSGRTLDNWLVSCGCSPGNPRIGIYFTSVIKCIGQEKAFELMAGNCLHFLQSQILTIRPALIITLGRKSYGMLRTSDDDYELALCKPVDTKQILLVTPFDFHYSLLHWPHPSGRNRWLNSPENRTRLQQSFEHVKRFIGSAQ